MALKAKSLTESATPVQKKKTDFVADLVAVMVSVTYASGNNQGLAGIHVAACQ